MKIKNLEGLTTDQIINELQMVAKFVIYTYTVSIIVMTFKRSTPVYFIRAEENAVTKGLLYAGISLVFGWWGIPWGPVYTIGSLVTNLGGGKNVTDEIMATVTSNLQS